LLARVIKQVNDKNMTVQIFDLAEAIEEQNDRVYMPCKPGLGSDRPPKPQPG